MFECLHRPAAGTGGIDDKLAPRGDTVAQWRDLALRSRPSHKVEFVLDAIEGSMADQDEHEVVFRFGVARHRAKRLLQLGARGLRSGERVDMRCTAAAALKILSRSLAAAVKRCS